MTDRTDKNTHFASSRLKISWVGILRAESQVKSLSLRQASLILFLVSRSFLIDSLDGTNEQYFSERKYFHCDRYSGCTMTQCFLCFSYFASKLIDSTQNF